jgi:hypothetical protein
MSMVRSHDSRLNCCVANTHTHGRVDTIWMSDNLIGRRKAKRKQ